MQSFKYVPYTTLLLLLCNTSDLRCQLCKNISGKINRYNAFLNLYNILGFMSQRLSIKYFQNIHLPINDKLLLIISMTTLEL